MFKRILRQALLAIAALIVVSQAASAHFIWITIASDSTGSSINILMNETPVPGGPEFLKMVRDVKPTVDGQPLTVTPAEETVNAHWAGRLPSMIDVESDLGVKSRDNKTYHLYYTARAQTAAVTEETNPSGDKLRVRLIVKDGKALAQVLFNGKSLPKARLRIYPENDGEPKDATADDQGFAAIDGLAEGKTALWANHVEKVAGEVNGKSFDETRYYATLTFHPETKAAGSSTESKTTGAERPRSEAETVFATMQEPAVNSFGGAVLGDWLYVYSGHIGKTHEYNVDATSRHFRRLNTKDRSTWEELPIDKDVQGVALVTDGKALYRLGGMSAKNQPGSPHDLHSVADFARFDPETKAWTMLPPLPTERSTHDAVVVGSVIYAVGGWTMKGATEESEYVNVAHAFDLANPDQGWKAIEQPFRRRALSAAQLEGKIYVLGGLNDEFKVERKVDIYDPVAKTWTAGPELPGNGKNDGFGTSAFNVDGRLYYSGAAGQVYRLNKEATSWEPIGAWSFPRITHRLLPGPGRSILAVGGNHKGKQVPMIEMISLNP